MTASIIGIGTAVPPGQAPQPQVYEFMSRVLKASHPETNVDRYLKFMEQIYAHSGIERRHGVIQDYMTLNPDEFIFFPKNWALEPFPPTSKRMEIYEHESVELAFIAAQKAIQDAGIAAADITHLIINTCTGFFAPGPDVALMKRLDLNPNTQRLIIGFMGCCAGFHGMRSAKHIIDSHPDAVVLHINIELCSLHFQKDVSRQTIIANSLFADGCSVVVYGGNHRFNHGIEIMETQSVVIPDCEDQMTWRIHDTGFIMTLDAAVPKTIRRETRNFLGALWKQAGISQDDMAAWAVHPGGKKIVESVEEALALHPQDTECSYHVLRNYGNMSSATLFFVVDRLRQTGLRSGYITAMGFGPGLVIEGAVFKVN